MVSWRTHLLQPVLPVWCCPVLAGLQCNYSSLSPALPRTLKEMELLEKLTELRAAQLMRKTNIADQNVRTRISCIFQSPPYHFGNELVSKYSRHSYSRMKNYRIFALVIDYVLNKLLIPNLSLFVQTKLVRKSCGVLCLIICHYLSWRQSAAWLDVSRAKLHYFTRNCCKPVICSA